MNARRDVCKMKKHIIIHHTKEIPAILWGKRCDRVIIAVHGDLSNKEDTVIALLAKNAIKKGYCVLSFDLPGHGERKDIEYDCNPSNAISDLQAVYMYAKSLNASISLFACSIGAYFSLLAFHGWKIQQTFFLSPVVDMKGLIENMMMSFQISEQRLKEERIISLPIGKTLDWDYYDYVKQHPVNFTWDSSIDILLGSKDTLTSVEKMRLFAEKYDASLTVMEGAEHYFHSNNQLRFFETWLKDYL